MGGPVLLDIRRLRGDADGGEKLRDGGVEQVRDVVREEDQKRVDHPLQARVACRLGTQRGSRRTWRHRAPASHRGRNAPRKMNGEAGIGDIAGKLYVNTELSASALVL